MPAPMVEHEFWRLVEGSRPKLFYSQKKHLKALTHALKQLPPAAILAFDERRRELLHRSYTWELWAAAYVIGNGCGDDGFDYFRSWLISRGCSFFSRVVANPDSLAAEKEVRSWLDELPEFEFFDYAASEAYETVTGGSMPASEVTSHFGAEPTGEHWDEDDDESMRRMVPQLMDVRGV